MSLPPKSTASLCTLRSEDSLEGVRVERRELIYLSLGAFAALTLRWPHALAGALTPLEGDLSWDAFLEHAVPMAERLVESFTPDEEAYLRALSSLARRAAAVPDVVLEPERHYDFGWSYDKLPFAVAQYKLAAGAAIPYHDHRDYNGVLRIVDGVASIRSFEIVGTDKRPPKGGTFLIRETRRELLGAGQLSTLSRTRDNIHDIRAGTDGVRMVDFFTFFSEDGASHYLDVDEQPRDPAKRIHEASWQVA
jgi:hypothetical protein